MFTHAVINKSHPQYPITVSRHQSYEAAQRAAAKRNRAISKKMPDALPIFDVQSLLSPMVVGYSAPGGFDVIFITEHQEAILESAGVWPKNEAGREYVNVYCGYRRGQPTYTDAQIEAMCKQ